MCNLGEGIAERAEARGLQKGMEQATAEYVSNMYTNNLQPEQIATLLKLSLDKVTSILRQQGYLQA